jgi:DNA-binding CsgD family transcriptional regulator
VDIVGREREIVEVERLLDRAVTAPARLALLGEPGIGKTTVWEAGVEAAEQHGFRVLRARPAEAESSLAYAGLTDLLAGVDEQLFDRLPDPQRQGLGVALLRAVPDGAPTDARAVFAGFGSVVAALAEEQPVVVAIDDLQWLDGPSARALEFVGRRLPDLPVALLTAVRVERGTPEHLGIDDRDRLRLRPLSPAALQQLIKHRLGVSLPRPTLLRLHGACGGNAFFALEIARVLAEQDALDANRVWPLTDDVRDLVEAHLASLPEQARATLLLLAAASQPERGLVDAQGLETAEQAGLVRVDPGGRIRFAHPLYASAVYLGATPDARRRAHAELAAQSEPLERARHFALATEHPDAAVTAELESAAGLAVARGAPEIGAELFERAAELTAADEPDVVGRRTLSAAGLYLQGGAPEKASRLLEALLEQSPEALRAEALHLLALVRFRQERYEEAFGLLHEGLAQASSPEVRASIELDLAFVGLSSTLDHRPALIHADAAVEYAERGAEGGLLAAALAVRVLMGFLLGEGVDEARMARALELEDETIRWVEARPALVAAFLALYVGRIDRAKPMLEAIRRELSQRGQEAESPLLTMHLAWLSLTLGELPRARELSEEALGFAALGGMWAAHALAFDAIVEAFAGDAERCRERMAAAATAAGAQETCLVLEWSAIAVALLEGALGDMEAVDAGTETIAAFYEQFELVDPVHLSWLPDKIEALVALGDLERAKRLTALLGNSGRHFGRPPAIAGAERSRAVMLAAEGDLEGAYAALVSALERLELAPLPLELARTLLLLGQVQRRRKQKTAAREALERSVAICDGVGATLWAERARGELTRLGIRREADELTPSEARVAELAAFGLTNREIAAAAFMSQKTVEANLSRIYRKLGIRSRAQLALRLEQRVASA